MKLKLTLKTLHDVCIAFIFHVSHCPLPCLSRNYNIVLICSAGLSLCGAGAGGYAVVILRRDRTRKDLFNALNAFNPSDIGSLSAEDCSVLRSNGLTISSVTVDVKGIATKEFQDEPVTGSSDDSVKGRLADYLFL